MKRVLFVCVHNSGRSQMAEAFLRHLSQGDFEAQSAGTIPSGHVNPVVTEAMREKGIDLSLNRPKLLTQGMVERADRVITMGCSIEEACPAVFVPSEDWGLEDPKSSPSGTAHIKPKVDTRQEAAVLERP